MRITSPSRGAEVRGRRVQLMLRQRKVAIEGGDDVSIAYGPNVLKAPQIQYQHPAADAGTKIGTFRASGPGTLSYVPDVNKPDQVFQAEWQASVELGRHNGQPVLTVAGRPRLGVTNMGMLTADQVRRVSARGGSRRQNAADAGSHERGGPGRDQFARTDRADAAAGGELPRRRAESGRGRGCRRRAQLASGLAQFNLDRGAGPVERTVPGAIGRDAARGGAARQAGRADDARLQRQRGVPRVAERASSNGQEPFEVSGGQLTAEQLDTDALVTIRGARRPDAAVAATRRRLAQIRARGMTVHAADVKLDVGQNRLWIDGPGVANMVLKRASPGSETATPTPLELRWQGGTVFDGRTIARRTECADRRARRSAAMR